MDTSYLKASIDGLNGAGKSGTAVRLAVGIAKEYCGGAPVVAFDSEERYRFYKPVIFDKEKISLRIFSGKSLVTLREAIAAVEFEGAGVFIGDQLTTPWMEGVKAFSFENGNLTFERRQQLMNQWEPIVDTFRYGKFHAICCGRLGFQWANVEDPETGDRSLVQGDSKFNAGGGNNFGYEADLELELRRRKRNFLGLLRGRTSVEHVCDVVKDATAGLLNGQQFTWNTTEGLYKVGDYKQVLDSFRPYLDFMKNVPPPEPNRSSTKDLIVSGKTAWAKDQSERKGLLEEIDGLFTYCFGSRQSKLGAMFHNLTLEAFGYGWSWSRMEEGAPTPELIRNRDILRAVRRRVDDKQIPTDAPSLLTLLNLATRDVIYPGRPTQSLFEAMSAESLNRHRGPQPITKVLDQPVQDEVAGD